MLYTNLILQGAKEASAGNSSLTNWLTSAAIAAVVGLMVTTISSSYWESRKLLRAERAKAYADFASSDSVRWEAFAERDRAKAKHGIGAEEFEKANKRVIETRQAVYDAYARAQVIGSPSVVKAMSEALKVSDTRQQAFWNADVRSPGGDKRGAARRTLLAAARKDLKLSGLNYDK